MLSACNLRGRQAYGYALDILGSSVEQGSAIERQWLFLSEPRLNVTSDAHLRFSMRVVMQLNRRVLWNTMSSFPVFE